MIRVSFFVCFSFNFFFCGREVSEREMSYSFLADVFPTWKSGDAERTANGSLRDLAAGIDIYENFETSPSSATPKMPQPHSTTMHGGTTVALGDQDLLTESFGDYTFPLENQRGPGPKAFDADDDYFKLLSDEWLEDTTRYQAQARSPFQPKDYAEEEQQSSSSSSHPHKKGCMDVAKHLDQCEECRTRLENIFRKLLHRAGETKRAVVQATSSKLGGSLIDVLLLVGIGVFVIFVLDAFVKLGRYLTAD